MDFNKKYRLCGLDFSIAQHISPLLSSPSIASFSAPYKNKTDLPHSHPGITTINVILHNFLLIKRHGSSSSEKYLSAVLLNHLHFFFFFLLRHKKNLFALQNIWTKTYKKKRQPKTALFFAGSHPQHDEAKTEGSKHNQTPPTSVRILCRHPNLTYLANEVRPISVSGSL